MGSAETFSIDPEVEPPALKFSALMENDRRFRDSWHHKRKDLGDDSLSAYDMSLATLAVYAEWTEQEIVNLLIAHRRVSGNPAKGLRSDYLTRTLQRARQATVVKLKDYEAAKVHVTGETREVQLDEGLAELSTLLTLDVRRVVQRGLDPAFFTLETDAGELHIGSAEILLSAHKARAKILPKAPYFPAMTKKQWERCIALICRLREFEELGEGQRDTEMHSWVESYFNENPRSQPESEASLAQVVAAGGRSFIWEDSVYLRVGHFGQFLFKFWGVKMTTNMLAERLSEIGWIPHRFRCRDASGVRKECNTWIEKAKV
jgi:hypothetical protein